MPEKTLNELLEKEAEQLMQAARYERNEARQGYRSGHYDRKLTITSGDTTLACNRRGYWAVANTRTMKARPLYPKDRRGGLSDVLIVLQFCNGVNKGGAVYRTVRTVLRVVG